MSLFGSHDKHPNLTKIAESLRTHLGMELTPPPDDVVAVLEQMTRRELLNFDNLHSIEGMQELFRVRSLRALVEPGTRSVTLSICATDDLEQEIVQEHSLRKVLHVGGHHATQSIVRSPSAPMLGAKPVAAVIAAAPAPTLTGRLEHLEGMEHLLPQIVDLFVKHGRLNTGDKEVLKNIRPTDFSSVEARLTALERWQAEVGRRVRGLHVQRAGATMLTGVVETAKEANAEELHGRRFEAVSIWMSKLIKAFEHTGVKFHNKPMWLPH